MAIRDLVKKQEQKGRKERGSSITVSGQRYIDLQEVSRVLERSIYRTRQIIWEGKLEKTKKYDRKIYVSEIEVKNFKKQLTVASSGRSELATERLGKRVQKAANVITEMVKADKVLNAQQRKEILGRLAGYKAEGGTLLNQMKN